LMRSFPSTLRSLVLGFLQIGSEFRQFNRDLFGLVVVASLRRFGQLAHECQLKLRHGHDRS
jgi:hypothetical protein